MRCTYCKDFDKNWSSITFGCWQLASGGGWKDCSTKDAEAVVKQALDCGITAFDTAEGYGDGESERRLSRALGDKRDDVIIISKIWPDVELTIEDFQERLETSLRNLGRDYLDVYLIHWPSKISDTTEKAKQLHEIMFSLKASGKVRRIGLSNFHFDDLALLGEGLADFSINQVPYSLLDRRYEGDTLKLCQEKGLAYMAYSPIAKGLLARSIAPEELEYPSRHNDPLFHQPTLGLTQSVIQVVQQIAAELNWLPVHVALAWVCAQPNLLTAIVGSRQPRQVIESATAGSRCLSPEHLQQLTDASNQFLSEVESIGSENRFCVT